MRIRSTAIITLGALAVMSGAATAQSAGPAGLIVSVTGTPVLVRAGDRLALSVGARLEPGDSIDLTEGSAIRMLHRTGRIENVTASVKVPASTDREDAGIFVRAVRTLASVAAADPGAVLNREGMIRPIPGSAVAISPRNGLTITDTTPVFTWFSVPGATGYTIQLRPARGSPLRFDTGSDTVWTPATPLARGVDYQWTVAAHPAGRPAVLQRFRIAGPVQMAASAEAIEAAASGDAPDVLFLAALSLHHAGLLYEARQVLDRLIQATPAVDPDVHLLHADILARLGEHVAAAASLRKAGR